MKKKFVIQIVNPMADFISGNSTTDEVHSSGVPQQAMMFDSAKEAEEFLDTANIDRSAVYRVIEVLTNG